MAFLIINVDKFKKNNGTYNRGGAVLKNMSRGQKKESSETLIFWAVWMEKSLRLFSLKQMWKMRKKQLKKPDCIYQRLKPLLMARSSHLPSVLEHPSGIPTKHPSTRSKEVPTGYYVVSWKEHKIE